MSLNGKNKALTFGFDDGITQDIRLLEILNRYGLRATFHLNYGTLGTERMLVREGKQVTHNKIARADVPHVYRGHEVAGHTLNHPDLLTLPEEEAVREVEEDRLRLSELVGYEVVGFAYPGGHYSPELAELLRRRTGVRYARVVETTRDLCPQKQPYTLRASCYFHTEWEEMLRLGEQLLAAPADQSAWLYIWGHSFEFDIYPKRWQLFEEFCRRMAGRPDVQYGTVSEVLLKKGT